MNTLKLTLKKKWFDMILSGEKKEEYREIKPYFISRLCYDSFSLCNTMLFNLEVGRRFYRKKTYDSIEFKNVYSKTAPTMIVELKGIKTGIGKREWGAEMGERYFILELGAIISTENIKS